MVFNSRPSVVRIQAMATPEKQAVLSGRFRAWRFATLLSMLVGYAGFYLCRANLDAALPLIGSDLGLSKVALGTIATVSIWVYAAGKFTHGVTVTLIGGKALFVLGLVGAAIFSAAFGLGTTLGVLILLWSLNRFVQAGGWIGMTQMAAQWYRASRGGTVMAVLSTSYLAGDVAARALSGALVRAGYAWPTLFFVPAVIVLCIALAAWLFSRASPEGIGEPPLPAAGPAPDLSFGALRQAVGLLLGQPSFWMYGLLSVTLTSLRLAFLTWTSSYLLSLGGGAGAAIFKSTVFPAAGLLGALFAGLFSDLVSRGRRGPIMVALLALNTAALIGLAGPWARSTTVTLVLVGVCGFSLIGPYSIIAGAGAIDLGGRQAAGAAASLLDGLGYVFGAALGGVGMGALAQLLGWSGAFSVLAVISGLSIVPATLIARWNRAEISAS